MKFTESYTVRKLTNSRVGILSRTVFRVFMLFSKTFSDRKIAVQAQSLAYTTIFTLVPVLVVFFSIVGFITEKEAVKGSIKQFVSVYLFPEYVNSVFFQLEKLSESSLAFGAVGLPALFISGVFLYAKVDLSINEIWLSQKKNQWFKNGLAFFMTLFFGPMILILVFSITPYLQTLPYYREVINYVYVDALFTQLIPISIQFVGFFVLYLYIPATRVRYSAAAGGALIAAVTMQLGNFLISIYLKTFSSLDILFGSLAIIPIFLLWVFVTWLIVLSGAALAFIFHYYQNTGFLDTKGMYNNESLLCSALRIIVYLAHSFEKRDGAPDIEEIQLRLGINRKRLSYVIDILRQERLVTVFEEGTRRREVKTRYQPGQTPEEIHLNSLVPLFYHPHEFLFFNKPLNEALRLLEIHPSFLNETITLRDLIKRPDGVLSEIQSVSGG